MPRPLLLAACLVAVACTSARPTACPSPAAPVYQPAPAQQELDDIYTLLALSVVLENWQTSAMAGTSRGYNIGSVLVDGSNQVVCWAVNSVHATGNGTDHGEVRLMTNYLRSTRRFSLAGHTVYTTLEPCAMCAGMMTMQSIARTIYAQRDPLYGAALERLSLSSTAIGGYCPYPRTVLSAQAATGYARELDAAYHRYSASQTSPRIIQWLTTAETRDIFTRAAAAFRDYRVTYPENQPYLDAARRFLAGVPSAYQAIPYGTNCPAETAVR